MAWHPSKKIVAVGWENGELLVWNEQDHNLFEGVHMHKAPITLLQWSSNGTRLFTGDKVSFICVDIRNMFVRKSYLQLENAFVLSVHSVSCI